MKEGKGREGEGTRKGKILSEHQGNKSPKIESESEKQSKRIIQAQWDTEERERTENDRQSAGRHKQTDGQKGCPRG